MKKTNDFKRLASLRKDETYHFFDIEYIRRGRQEIMLNFHIYHEEIYLLDEYFSDYFN